MFSEDEEKKNIYLFFVLQILNTFFDFINTFFDFINQI